MGCIKSYGGVFGVEIECYYGDFVFQKRCFIGFAGVPKQIVFSGNDLKTLLLAPTTTLFSIVTPGATNTSVAIQHPFLMVIFFEKISKFSLYISWDPVHIYDF